MNIVSKLTLAALLVATAAHADTDMPLRAPHIDAASWVLMSARTGQILTAANENERRNPASLTKLMTTYVAEQALDEGRITLNDPVTIGNDAWATRNPVFKGSSLMFLKPGDKATVSDLLRGIIIDSGNDACVALSDYVSGGQQQFVEQMNANVKLLNMPNTHFETVHGLDAPGQYSSARDMAVLAQTIINSEPTYYPFYSEKSLTWNGVTQRNRNGLLWDKTLHVDGMKTGHTETAGYNLVATSIDGEGQRLIAVVMGAASSKGREEQAKKLLLWGQNNFETVQLAQKDRAITREKVWYGLEKYAELGAGHNLFFTLPKGAAHELRVRYTLKDKDLKAPVAKGTEVGVIEYVYHDQVIGSEKLYTLSAVKEAGIFSRLKDFVSLKLS